MTSKAKAARNSKKAVHSYCIGFGFRPPYQILLDGEFCKVALDKHIYIKDEFPALMGGPTRLMTTECILHELKSKGIDHTSAYILAKKSEIRRCPHKENPISSYECIRELIGTSNKNHLWVASQNPKLKDRLRKIPGVPLLYANVKQTKLGLEPMSDISKEAMKVREVEKIKPLDNTTLRLKRAFVDKEKVQEDKPKPKKRKVKGVNPLAMKKKKKAPAPPKKKNSDKNDKQ